MSLAITAEDGLEPDCHADWMDGFREHRGKIDPAKVLTQVEPLSTAMEAQRTFDSLQARWVKAEFRSNVAMATAA